MNQEEGCTCRHKHREVTEERGLMNRLNRIEGADKGYQVHGGGRALLRGYHHPRWQRSRPPLTALTRCFWSRHIKSCVVDDIRRGDSDATGGGAFAGPCRR